MKMLFTYLFTLIMLLLQSSANAQITDTELVLSTPTGDLSGSFMQSSDSAREHTLRPKVVALIIAGSGPTDRNGNNPQMTNNSLKRV